MTVSVLSGAEPTAQPSYASEAKLSIRPVEVGQVSIQDRFWGPKLEVFRKKAIPHSWRYLEGELRALRKAAGQEVQGELNGTWGEANLFKFLETVAYALAAEPDPALQRRADEIIELVGRAQRPDGYAHAYVTNSRKQPWDPGFLDGSHDGYVLGHMIQAALAYQAATGETRFIEIARRAADQAWRHFLGSTAKPGFCGHAELEMALIELYRATRDQRYLDLARAWVEWRGHGVVKPFSTTPRAYFQDAVPVREQYTLEGHAVRAVFFATGVADLALETSDPDYRVASERFWDCLTRRRMTITGSIGPRKEHEALGEDYELPNDGYYESCAACGLADFAHRMFLLTGRGECADVLETVLYNAVLHGIGLGGTNSYYQNPLSDCGHPRYNSWVCCPPNLSRTLLKIGRYAYAQSGQDVWINLYIAGICRLRVAETPLTINVETDYPWNGKVRVSVAAPTHFPLNLNLRSPSWAGPATVTINGTNFHPALSQGYLQISRAWNRGDVVELEFPIGVQRIEAHPNIQDCRGKVALRRGPIVYGFEGLDNGGKPQVTFGVQPAFGSEFRPELLGGVTVVSGIGADGRSCLAIPFYALANRSVSCQEVWCIQRGLRPDASWWLGKLYRPLDLR